MVVDRVPEEGVDRLAAIAVPALRRRDPEPRQRPGRVVAVARREVSGLPCADPGAVPAPRGRDRGARSSAWRSSTPRPLRDRDALRVLRGHAGGGGSIDLEHRIIPNKITYPAFPAFALAIVIGWAIGQELDPLPRADRSARLRGRVLRHRVHRAAWPGHGRREAHRADRTGDGGARSAVRRRRRRGRDPPGRRRAASWRSSEGGAARARSRSARSSRPARLSPSFWGERIAAWYLRSMT